MARISVVILLCGLCIYNVSCGNASNNVSDFDPEVFYPEEHTNQRIDDIIEFDMERFQNEKNAWEALDIIAYRFTVRLLGDYPSYFVRITVNSAEEPEVEPLPHDDYFTEEDMERAMLYGKTIAEIYTSIEAGIERLRKTLLDEPNWIEISIKHDRDYH